MPKSRILIVEDEVDILNALVLYFEEQGFEVLTAKRGEPVGAICRAKRPNTVILDIKLPDIDGHEVCRRLRDDSRTGHIPIMFLTQKIERSDILAGLALGVDDYITKPFDAEELLWRVEKSVRSSRRGALSHPVTNLPTGSLVAEHLEVLKKAGQPHVILYFTLSDLSGAMPADEVLVRLADIIGEVVGQYGSPDDFTGQTTDQELLVTTTPKAAAGISETVSRKFEATIGQAARLSCRQAEL